MVRYLIFSICIFVLFPCSEIQLDVLCRSGHSPIISIVERLWRSKSAVWCARTKWLSYCNSRQGWDAWIQSTTWKAGSLVSHTAHIKEQTGEWHRAFLWSSRSQEWERVVDGAPQIAPSPHPSDSPALTPPSLSHSQLLWFNLSFDWLQVSFRPRHSWLRS